MTDDGAISLYLDLEPHQNADMEVVARASLAWVAVLREIANTIDPMSETRVELESGTEGSLSLNSVVRLVKGSLPSKDQLRVIVLAAMLWMGEKTVDWTYNKIMDRLYTGPEQKVVQGMTDREISDTARILEKALKSLNPQPPQRQVFRELERDRAIRGVGVSPTPAARPDHIIPRSEFAERAGQSAVVEEEAPRRTVTIQLPVILVSPVLKDAERSWRFQPASLDEFGAVMKDRRFLEALRLGRISVPLRPGIEMVIELQTKEENVDGSWVVVERAVTRVISPAGGEQRDLFPAPEPQPDGGDHKEE